MLLLKSTRDNGFACHHSSLFSLSNTSIHPLRKPNEAGQRSRGWIAFERSM